MRSLRIPYRFDPKINDPGLEKKYKEYFDRAKNKGIEFSLTRRLFRALCTSNCYICGNIEGVNGVDRLDNNIGYTDLNSAPCCWNCNRSKNNMSINEFKIWLSNLNAKPNENFNKTVH